MTETRQTGLWSCDIGRNDVTVFMGRSSDIQTERFSLPLFGGEDAENDANTIAMVQLMCAARNSYDKHFGPNAIAAAESDWIGRAIKVLRAAVAYKQGCVVYDAAELLRELKGTQ